MKHLVLQTVFTILLVAQPAAAQYIGIFMDPGAASCASHVGANPWIDLYLIAILEGNEPEALGTQFQVTGMPASWNATNTLWVPDTDMVISIGHPMFPNASYANSGGVNLAFGVCRGPGDVNGRVLLGRIVLLGAPTPDDVFLQVESVELVPTDLPCPMINQCDQFAAKACVSGGGLVLNGTARPSCQVAVEESSWSQIRLLYQ